MHYNFTTLKQEHTWSFTVLMYISLICLPAGVPPVPLILGYASPSLLDGAQILPELCIQHILWDFFQQYFNSLYSTRMCFALLKWSRYTQYAWTRLTTVYTHYYGELTVWDQYEHQTTLFTQLAPDLFLVKWCVRLFLLYPFRL